MVIGKLSTGVLLLAGLSGAAVGTQTNSHVGRPAPELGIDSVLQGPATNELDWSSLRGRAMLIEFWGTWCAPCLANISHLNELVEQFQARPIEFLSISSESSEKVEKFLERRPISGWVAVDPDSSSFDAFSVKYLPTTVLVGADGIVKAVTGAPEAITAETLDRLLAGDEELGLPNTNDGLPVDAEGRPEVLFEVRLAPSQSSSGGWSIADSRERGRYSAGGIPLPRLMESLFSVRPGRMISDQPLADQRYDIVVGSGGNAERWVEMARWAVVTGLGLEPTWERRAMDGYVLAAGPFEPRVQPALEIAGDYSRADSSRLEASNFERFCDQLARRLEAPVVNETGLEGRYYIELRLDPSGVTTLPELIRRQLGLELRREERQADVLVIRRHGNQNQ